MKSDSWLLIVMRSLKGVRTLRVEKRTVIVLTCGAIFFAGALIFFAYEYASFLEERRKLTSEIGQLMTKVSALEQKLKRPSAESRQVKPNLPPLAIDDLRVVRRGSRGGVAVRFRLVNRSPQEVPISGTLAMVAKNESMRNPIYRVIPEMHLSKGIPQQPEKGSRFEVRRQKFVEAFFDSSPEGSFKTLTIYIFSPDGHIVSQTSTDIPEE
jgi:hypothetical protein